MTDPLPMAGAPGAGETAPQTPSGPPMAAHFPLRATDPAKVGDFWLNSRVTATPAGTAFVAHEDGGDSVMVLLLSEGAAADPAARSRFSGEINAMHIDTVVARGGEGQNEGRTAVRFRSEDDDPVLHHHAPLAPWAALAFDGSLRAVQEADRVLLAVDLSAPRHSASPRVPTTGSTGSTRPTTAPPANGRSWPGRRDRAGWMTLLASFLLMVILALLALILAILVFQNQPPVNAPQPIPSPASGEGSGSGEPQSGEPQDPGSGDPTDGGSGSASPSPGEDGGPYTHSPSMNVPSGNQSGPGAPSPNPRL